MDYHMFLFDTPSYQNERCDITMPLTENQKQSRYKYAKKALKRIPLDVPKEKYEEIKTAALIAGESVNGYIKKAIEERMKHDNVKSPLLSTPNELEQKPNTPAANEPVLIEAAYVKEDIPKLDTLMETSQSTQKRYKLFTEAEAKLIDLSELLTNVRYQIDIAETFGMKILRTLM